MAFIEYYYADFSGLELVLTHNAGRHYPWHAHTRHWTAGLVQSGMVTLKTAGSLSLALRTGERFMVPPRVGHSLSVAPESRLIVLCCSERQIHPSALLHFDIVSRHPLLFAELTLLSDTLSRWGNPELPGPQQLNSPDFRPGPDTPVQAVLNLLSESPEEAYPLKRLATFAGYSPWHFLRRFRNETGMTPHAFQLSCRLSRPRSLLRTGTASAAAAAALGFADQSHMQRFFKLHHGLTPRQFRQVSFTLEQ